MERRLWGECIPFDPWQDGSGRTVCVMTTPQDGTLGGLTSEGEALDGSGVGRAMGALRDTPPSPLPGRVDHRTQYLNGCMTVSNQQACGWCVVHAATALLEALHCSKGCDVPELSESHLRSNSFGGAAFGSCSEGWFTDTALQTLVDAPIVDAETWPYVSNGRGLNVARPSDAELRARAVHQPTGWHNVDLADLETVKRELASEREIIIAVPVYYRNGMDGRDDWNSDVANVRVPPTETPCACGAGCMDAMCLGGYHAIALVGYDDATREFTFVNSWGRGWGSDGYGRMSYDFLTTYGSGGAALDDVKTSIPGNACSDDLDGGTPMPTDGGMPMPGDGGVTMTRPDGGTLTPPVPGDRCSTIADCARCTATSGCGFCDGTGCRSSSYAPMCAMGSWNGSTCATAMDPCATSTGCGDCVARDGCQWCAESSRCFSPSLRTVECFDPRNAADQCSDCSMGATCDACVGLEGCGWCPGSGRGVVAPGAAAGSCVLGSDTAADRESCEAYRGTREACTSDQCRLITECSTCQDTRGCGWCDGSDRCMVGNFFGPTSDETFGSTCGEDWDWFGLFCDNTDAACGNAASCQECISEIRNCTWNTMTNACEDGVMSDETHLSGTAMCPGLCGGPFSMCTESTECCDGLECVNDNCVDCGGAARVGASCDPSVVGACCGTLTCAPITSESDNRCCKRDRDRCTSNDECCGQMTCTGGVCACRTAGQSCFQARECCGGAACIGGVCT
jgi:hypothetical protein